MREGLTITPGTCWGCGCTDQDACFDEVADNCCHWVDEQRTWCSVCALKYAQAIVLREGGALEDEPLIIPVAA